jgi:uncharacterized coiled-coil DUF342 family protein
LSVLQADFSVEDGKRRRLDEEVSKARSKAAGIFTQAQEQEEVEFRMRTMENRLDTSYLRYSNNLTRLVALRSEIDELRKQRFTFRDVIRKGKQERAGKDEAIGRLISESNEAYSRRDGLKMRLTQIRTAERKSIREYQETLTRLNDRIETQTVPKGHHPTLQPALSSTPSQVGNSSDQTDELAIMTESAQTGISGLLQVTGFQNVDEMVREADHLERENFSLYNFVVESGSINAKIQEELENLQKRKDELDRIAAMTDEEQSIHLESLTNQITEISHELDQSRICFQQETDEFKEVYERMQTLFEGSRCSWTECPDGKSNVSVTNIMWILQTLE